MDSSLTRCIVSTKTILRKECEWTKPGVTSEMEWYLCWALPYIVCSRITHFQLHSPSTATYRIRNAYRYREHVLIWRRCESYRIEIISEYSTVCLHTSRNKRLSKDLVSTSGRRFKQNRINQIQYRINRTSQIKYGKSNQIPHFFMIEVSLRIWIEDRKFQRNNKEAIFWIFSFSIYLFCTGHNKFIS